MYILVFWLINGKDPALQGTAGSKDILAGIQRVNAAPGCCAAKLQGAFPIAVQTHAHGTSSTAEGGQGHRIVKGGFNGNQRVQDHPVSV